VLIMSHYFVTYSSVCTTRTFPTSLWQSKTLRLTTRRKNTTKQEKMEEKSRIAYYSNAGKRASQYRMKMLFVPIPLSAVHRFWPYQDKSVWMNHFIITVSAKLKCSSEGL
jgi:hypothetical protein